jgi:hypothetical protein
MCLCVYIYIYIYIYIYKDKYIENLALVQTWNITRIGFLEANKDDWLKNKGFNVQ